MHLHHFIVDYSWGILEQEKQQLLREYIAYYILSFEPRALQFITFFSDYFHLRIYGRILSDLGLLSKGEVVLKCASDFVGDALGVSEKTTQAILQSAEGCVLVIDEAYSLYTGGSTGSGTNDPYKTAVIDTIVEKVQAKPGADIAVVMIGYEEEMKNMMSHVNPGLSRRFQIDEAFHFPDFNDEALLR